jgi:hypothetical protein
MARDGYPPRSLVEHPLVVDATRDRKGGDPFACRTDLDPRFDALREEERRRGNQDAFLLQGTRRTAI